MKRLIGIMVALIPLGIATGAWAQSANSGALNLGSHQVGTDSMVMHDAQRMTNVTSQVNQDEAENVESDSSAPSSPPSQRTEVSDILPEGMVVRSSTFGGVTVGVEF